jgi:hypothetical protein
MVERRKPSPVSAALRSKMRQIEDRMARLEDHVGVLRVEARRTTGLSRIRLKRLERRARVQIARTRRAVRDSASRLSRALARADTREEVARHVAKARAAFQDSLDRVSRTLADSSKGLTKEAGLLARGLKVGLRAGSQAYRRKRD